MLSRGDHERKREGRTFHNRSGILVKSARDKCCWISLRRTVSQSINWGMYNKSQTLANTAGPILLGQFW